MSDSLWPHGLQHSKLHSPSPSPRACSNWMSIELVMPSNHFVFWHLLLLLPSNLSQHQGLFQWVSSSHQVAKVLELQLQHQSFQRRNDFQWIFRVYFFQDWLVWSPCCPRDSQESSPESRFKGVNSSVCRLPYGQTLMSIHDMTTGKTIALTFVKMSKDLWPLLAK